MNILHRFSDSNPEHPAIALYHAHQDGALTAAETTAYQQHLDSCRYCQTWVDDQRIFAQKLKNGEPPQAILSPAASARIQQNITSQVRRAMIMNNFKSFASATAAVVVLAVVVGFFLGQYRDRNTAETAEPAAAVEEAAPEIATPEGTIDEQLAQAVKDKDVATVERLLEAGADPNFTNSAGDPILKMAIFAVGSSPEIVELLVEHGADVNAPDKDGNPLLPQVARKPRPEMVQLLLDAGADVNSTMNLSDGGPVHFTQAPALIHAVVNDQIEVVEVLIANGADMNQAELSYKDTALHIAAYNNRAEIVKVLLENGAEPSPVSTFGGGQTPLHFAAANGSLEAIQALLDGGIDADEPTGVGYTPIMQVIKDALSGQVSDTVSVFLAGGADPNKQDNNGNTALHHAARWGKADVIPLLVEAGADPNLENNAGKTALDLAIDEPVIELLTELTAGQ